MKKLLAALIATIGVSTVSYAGFVIEPEIGAQGVTGASQFQYKYNTTTYNYNQASYPVGIRLKFQNPNGFWYGIHADYYMSGTMTPASTTQIGGNDTFTRTVASAELGYQGARGLRVFGGYDFMNNIANTPNTATAPVNSNDFTALNGSGYYVGAGWMFSQHFAINVLYDVPSYSGGSITPKNAGSGTTMTSTTYNSFTDSLVNVNVSFPFGGAK